LGIGGLSGGMMSVCFNVKGINPFVLFVILFLLAGFLAVARLRLNRETSSQVYTGFIAGFLLAYLCVWLSAGYLFL
jgi:membrane-associated phospholipid phosphatase